MSHNVRLVFAVLGLAAPAFAAEPETLGDLPAAGGLAVLVGPSDGSSEARLAATGRWLVLCLTPDEATRHKVVETIDSAGQAGVVAVAVWQTAPHLPLADHSANLIVADLDALRGKLSEAEVRRVLAPMRGRARVTIRGRQELLEKPMPAEFDEWTHFFHAADGNAVSRDTAIGVPNALRFVAGPRLQDSNGANGYRLSRGIAVSEWNYTAANSRDNLRIVLEARDALNGTLLWQQVEPVYRGAVRSAKTKPLILADGRLLRVIDDGREAARIAHFDPETGKLVRVYQSSANLRSDQYRWGASPQFNYADGLIVQAAGREVRCIDAKTGELRWSFEGPEGRGDLFRPIMATDLGLVFLMEAPAPEDAEKRGKWGGPFGGRYPGILCDYITALDLKTGKPAWRVERDPQLEQLHGEHHYPRHGEPAWQANRRKIVYHVSAYKDGRLFLLYACDANGGGPSMVLCHDAKTGKQLWYTVTKPDYDPAAKKISGGEMFDMFLLDDGTLLTYGHAWARIDQETGQLLAFGNNGGNARCDTGTCTVHLMTAGFGNYFDLTGDGLRWTRRDIARGQCGGRSTPAYGMSYFHGSGCGCFFMVRGNMALYRTDEPTPLPDSERTTTGPAAAAPLTDSVGPVDWPEYLGAGDRRAWTTADGPRELKLLWKTKIGEPITPDVTGVRRDWLHTGLYNGPLTAPVVADGLAFVADRDRRMVTAVDVKSGERRWTYRADGRVFTPPTYHRGRLVFGTRGGTVHCLDAASGKPAWRFLAAPTQRMIVSHGQVESAWPLHGSLPVVDGTVVASAGYHGEVDSGVWVWGLDLGTGAVRWHRRLYRPERPWKDYEGDALGQRVSDESHPLAHPNKSNGGYNVTRVRNVDLPSHNGRLVRVARETLDPRTGESIDFATLEDKSLAAGWAPMHYGERFPFLDMEFEQRGGPHGSGGWMTLVGRLMVGDSRGGRMRIAQNAARALLARPGGRRDENNHYIPGLELWWIEPEKVPPSATQGDPPRLRLHDLPPTAFLDGMDELDSLVVAGSLAYISAEGRKEIPWGTGTRMVPRDTKGEPISGRLQVVSLPAGEPVARVEIDTAVINNGLAVAAGRLFASCEDGTVRCYGE